MSGFEYATNWKRTCRNTLQLFPRCTCNPLHKASIIHHLKYKRSPQRRILGIFLLHSLKKSVSGFEIVGWDIVTVCESCHENIYGVSFNPSSVHYIKKWKQEEGELNNHNVWWFAWELRIKFWLWTSIYNTFKLLFLIIIKTFQMIVHYL